MGDADSDQAVDKTDMGWSRLVPYPIEPKNYKRKIIDARRLTLPTAHHRWEKITLQHSFRQTDHQIFPHPTLAAWLREGTAQERGAAADCKGVVLPKMPRGPGVPEFLGLTNLDWGPPK